MVDLDLEDQPFPMTEAEYLEFEAQHERMHDFVNGIVYPRIGVSLLHSRIRTNAGIKLHNDIANNPDIFLVYMMRTKIPSRPIYRYPDIVIMSEKIELYNNREDTITNPVVLIEVLSPETVTADVYHKVGEYTRIDSLQEYIIIAQDEPHVQQYLRHNSGSWLYEQFSGLAATLELPSIGCKLPLADIYRDIEFEEMKMGSLICLADT